MSGELDAAGAMATAGLVAGAIEGRGGGDAAHGACLNCGAELTGRYCANCGQAAHAHRSMAHVFEEFLHGVLHFDTKAWRTLPLVIGRPGTLTRNYIYGKRARYISPLALFLFCVFFMFFVFSFTKAPPSAVRAEINTEQSGPLHAEVGPSPPPASAPPQTHGESWQEQLREDARTGEARIETGNAWIDQSFQHAFENPDLSLYKIQQAAYKWSFLLVPISLPFIALLFLWKRGLTLYDHVVFSLYSLSFASLVFVGVVLSAYSPWTQWIVLALILFALPVHTYFHLKGAYALGWFSALWRTFFMLIFATVSLAIFVLVITLLGVAH